LEDERVFRGKLDDSVEAQFYRTILEYGMNTSILKATDYARRYEKLLNLKRFHHRMRTFDEHLKTREALFNSIRKHGFKFKKRKGDQVKILLEPFWKTRYNLRSEKITGPEIWNGVETCAILQVLGEERVKGLFMKDNFPGTRGCARLENVYKL
jgi:hypothetical protein